MKQYESTGEYHILSMTTNIGVHRVGVKSKAKRITKKTKEYLDDLMEEVIEIRKTMGKRV